MTAMLRAPGIFIEISHTEVGDNLRVVAVGVMHREDVGFIRDELNRWLNPSHRPAESLADFTEIEERLATQDKALAAADRRLEEFGTQAMKLTAVNKDQERKIEAMLAEVSALEDRVTDPDAICCANAGEIHKAQRVCIERLETRQQELLRTIFKISQETPLPSEFDGWQEQRAKLVAEVGTLKATIAEMQRRYRDYRDGTETFRQHPADVSQHLGLAYRGVVRLMDDAKKRGDFDGATAWAVAMNPIQKAESLIYEARTKQDWSKKP